MTGARNVRGGLVLLAAGLVAGLVMSVYAFEPLVPPPAGFARYDDLPRRLLRLAHIAAVMLALINVAVGPWLDRLRLPAAARAAASWLLLLGAATLPAALAVEALVPGAAGRHVAAAPALAFTAGSVLVAGGAWRTPLDKEAIDGSARDRGEDEGDRRRALQHTRRRA